MSISQYLVIKLNLSVYTLVKVFQLYEQNCNISLNLQF